MKIAETKIYIKFIFWFVLVSLLPLIVLFVVIYLTDKDLAQLLNDPEILRSILLGIFISLAFVFLLSLLATRYLSKVVANPIQLSLKELLLVVEELSKSIQNLSDISQNDSSVSQDLLTSSQEQEQGLKTGQKAVAQMVKSLNEIAVKAKSSAKDTANIDKLASDSGTKSQAALNSLAAVKHLVTENQKLSQALDVYAHKVTDIAKRVEVLAETAKFLSLNVSIEANKTSFGGQFSNLVSQIRELNITSQQAATSIQALVSDMSRQIEQAKQASVYEWQETNKSIQIVGQTINFLNRIVGNVGNIAKSTQIISQEAEGTQHDADKINSMISALNKSVKSLVNNADDMTKIIHKQLVVIRSLNKSSAALNKVTDNLNNLVGENSDYAD
ncbi:hypothetical protein C4566_00240 [Candidatus Parcubacteria bacterium]|nr:MAG: hypothetical protein C4566_00240 [Candidatus Parcubacteria bacterium]